MGSLAGRDAEERGVEPIEPVEKAAPLARNTPARGRVWIEERARVPPLRRHLAYGVDLAHADRKPDPYWAENCLWAGEKLWLCDEVEFEVDRKNPMKPWRASDRKGNIDITFHPEGGKKVGLEPFAVYHQKCGRFRGKITAGDGEVHEIRDYYGCAELANIFSR